MVEAMACGVPVIATPRGSVPEIVVDGVTGWIAASVEDMAAAVERCDEIDPRECRALAELHYSPERMVGGLRGRVPPRDRALGQRFPLLGSPALLSPRRRGFGRRNGGERPVLIAGERHLMLPLILILLLLAIVFGGFFVFSLKVAVVVAIVLLLVGAFGGYGYRGRRTV